MRKKIIAGNWKMHKDLAEANDFFTFFIENMPETDTEIILAPSYTNLWHAFDATRDYPIEIAAQNVHQETSGAYTGEVSAAMLKSIGIQKVIIGHSERRAYFGETNTILRQKVQTALQEDMQVIFCIGELLEDRKANIHEKAVEKQLKEALASIQPSAWQHLVLAYEPVWAIGTGETASPQQAQDMHKHIRKLITEIANEKTANTIPILYGGSVKPENAAELFQQPDIDGALVGGASLEVDSFVAILKAMS